MKKLEILLIASLILNGIFIFYLFSFNNANNILEESINVQPEHFEYISPEVAALSAEEFLEKQKTYQLSYTEMKLEILPVITTNVEGKYGIYFEDLNTGTWMGINEKDKFIPLSLLKVPLLVAVLKKVEQGSISLDDEVTLTSDDIDLRSGSLGQKGEGYKITIRELLRYLIKESDNTAMKALASRYTTYEDSLASLSALGLPQPTTPDVAVSPKEYSNIFRSLYLSNYLARPLSEYALTLMLNTDYETQLPAGVPSDVKVAHKVGFNKAEGYYHDCGLVYLHNQNYMLCIMSEGSTQEESDRVMSAVSKIVYEYNLKAVS